MAIALGATDVQTGIVVLCLGGLFLYLRSYLAKVAENQATKEDIAVLTTAVEQVKHTYAVQLEQSRAAFTSQLQVSHVRYQREYDVLVELADRAVSLRDVSVSLRNALEIRAQGTSDEEIKRAKLSAFVEAMKSFENTWQRKRPFYPEELYEVMRSLRHLGIVEYVALIHDDPRRDRPRDYWDEAAKNAEQLERHLEELLDAIRVRIRKWEGLDSPPQLLP